MTLKDNTSPPTAMLDLNLSRRSTRVKAWIEASPGATAVPLLASRGTVPIAIIYQVMGKMFAVLAVRSDENVILKCDPYLASALRKEYAGVGHRSHLDRRYWISISLDADVPTKEIKRLVSQSYGLVCATLTRKQRTDLEELTVGGGLGDRHHA